MKSSQYINEQRRNYSLYVLQQRAIPAAADGLKAAARRVLWTARSGQKYKAAVLAGATMPIHPHDQPDDVVCQLAGRYVNNICLLKGSGAFGTLLQPKDYGAARYTSVQTSKFTEEVMFRDIEVIPMKENYDGSLEEPVHFLPLVPMALINPSEGLAIGFRSDILPRSLEDIIVAQLTHLNGKPIKKDPMPKFGPTKSFAHAREDGEKSVFYYFDGEYEEVDHSTIRVTRLPYSLSHDSFISKVDQLIEIGDVVDCIDDSKSVIDIAIKFKKGFLRTKEKGDILKMLGLSLRYGEIFNILHFDGKRIWNPSASELIREFTDWRLKWYVRRYERLRDLLKADLQRYYDIRLAIKKEVNKHALKMEGKSEYMEFLGELGIVNTQFIAELPSYRFTLEERDKNEQKIKDAEAQMKVYEKLLSSEDERRKVYISELQEVLTKYTKGGYNE